MQSAATMYLGGTEQVLHTLIDLMQCHPTWEYNTMFSKVTIMMADCDKEEVMKGLLDYLNQRFEYIEGRNEDSDSERIETVEKGRT